MDVRAWLTARWSLGVACLVAVAAAVVLLVLHAMADPPVDRDAAGVRAEVEVMPFHDVAVYLAAHGVASARVPLFGGSAVVMHASWRRLPPRADASYTLLLSGDSCGAGIVDDVYGPSDDDVSLGSGSMWNETLDANPWLAGDRDIRLPDDSVTSLAQFASVPASYGGDVWAVGRLLDGCSFDPATGRALRAHDPHPRLGVALSTDDRVWWVVRAAG